MEKITKHLWVFLVPTLHQVQQSYAQSLKARDMGHAVLRQTWHESVILLGEMAALIVDGELFKIFVPSQHGCCVCMGALCFVLGSSWNWQHKDLGGLGAWENPVYIQKSWLPDFFRSSLVSSAAAGKNQRLCHDVATSTLHNSWQFPWNLVNFLPKHRKVTRLPEVDNEGCKSTLVVQTIKQLRSGVKASRMKTVGSIWWWIGAIYYSLIKSILW